MSHKNNDLPLFDDFPLMPDYSIEEHLIAKGYQNIAGVDEVGRGPLAGPVVTAAVILDRNNIPEGLNDSKKLSAKKREALYDGILRSALAVSICSLSAIEIDRTDIRKAALEAMRRAVHSLSVKAEYVLVDGRDIPPHLGYPAQALIKGDGRSQSIAAASIIAKVTRDRLMEKVGKVYPAYGFEKHAGYATAFHRAAIEREGPVKRLHRFSFAPIKGAF
ncbi:RNase HII [Bartonella apis]|uniref:ribonuclease HII n=1 Tax=Bartonella apis TaxID=1686310 RepID=UPI0009654A18|nr:ribonuclease HII [Bartonella apis]OLY45219.1 RNase HII [Bartonella apis]